MDAGIFLSCSAPINSCSRQYTMPYPGVIFVYEYLLTQIPQYLTEIFLVLVQLRTKHTKFVLTGVQTHDLQIMTVHFM